ncbi:hypothetical protein Tco_0447262, partial [Tanacetum coccineum]
MLMTMKPDYLENLGADDMLQELKTLFSQQEGTSSNRERVSRLQAGRRTVCKLICSKDEELYRQFGASRSSRVTKPSSEPHLGLSEKGISFVQNYNMHGMEKTVNELHAMLNLHEQTLLKKYAPTLHAI